MRKGRRVRALRGSIWQERPATRSGQGRGRRKRLMTAAADLPAPGRRPGFLVLLRLCPDYQTVPAGPKSP